MNETVVELGDQVKDPVTGFKGTAVAITTWMFGCRRVTVQPKGLDKDGKLFETQSFDEPGLTVTKRANTPKAVQDKRRRTGGPRPEVNRPQITSR